MSLEDIIAKHIVAIDALTAAITKRTALFEDGIIPPFAKSKAITQEDLRELQDRAPAVTTIKGEPKVTRREAAKKAPAKPVVDVIEPTMHDKLANGIMALAKIDESKAVATLAKFGVQKISQLKKEDHEDALEAIEAALTEEVEPASSFV